MPGAIDDRDPRAAERRRAEELFREHQRRIYRRTDRIFAVLMPLQWLAAVATALWISPLTWSGTTSSLHPHVLMALVFGGIVTVLPVTLALIRPEAAVTRHVIAVGQMLMSALLIHLTGGRIETHFHVFGSLAFLAFYRDWKVFAPATVVVAADHLVRGIFWPESVFGLLNASPWRWLEHAGWVLFEDMFLLISCGQSVHEMHDIARQRAQLEGTNRRIEAEVAARTDELRAAQEQNLQMARRAGMADIATGVLHNVGNILNSVNVSTSMIGDRLRKSVSGDLRRAAELLQEHRDDPGAFVGSDPRGRHLPGFLIELSRQMTADDESLLAEVAALSRSVGHIKEIVAVQQNYAGGVGFVEEVELAELVDDAIRINSASMDRHGITVQRKFEDLPRMLLDKQKFLQILVNLVSNARYAVIEGSQAERRITIRLARGEDEKVAVEVGDNGVGISAENLTRVFAHGFTTRREGHGFGLHSAANLARELGGRLTASSAGPGRGATFVLKIPFKAARSFHDCYIAPRAQPEPAAAGR